MGSDNTHVFPRGRDGGIVLGGSRFAGDFSEHFDDAVGQGIKERCCALVPELGRPEDLRILKQGVGIRRECPNHALDEPVLKDWVSGKKGRSPSGEREKI